MVKSMGAAGLARAKVAPDGSWTQSPLAKPMSAELRAAINQACGAGPGDILCFQFGRTSLVDTVMANLRLHVAKKIGPSLSRSMAGLWPPPMGGNMLAL